jgi:hypothetical protein
VLEHDDAIDPAAAECVDALFGQIKYGTSIKRFTIHLFPSNQVAMFNLRQFVMSNKRLENRWIESFDNFSQDQVDALWEAIAAPQLKNLKFHNCRCANDGTLEQLLLVPK